MNKTWQAIIKITSMKKSNTAQQTQLLRQHMQMKLRTLLV